MSELDLASLVTGRNLVLAGAAFVITSTLRTTFKAFFATRLGTRMLPLLPIMLALIGAFLGVGEGAETWQDKLVLGLIAGFAAGHLFKMGKTSVMGIGLPELSAPDPEGPVDPNKE